VVLRSETDEVRRTSVIWLGLGQLWHALISAKAHYKSWVLLILASLKALGLL
jgi:hypothetical protein